MDDDTQQVQEGVEQNTPAPEPSDLGEAMQMVGEANTKAPQESVPTEEVQSTQPSTDTREQYIQPAETTAVSDDGHSDAGGYTDGYTQDDYNLATKALVNNISSAARYYANESFKQQNIGTYNLNELYQTSEDGVVTFINPDNPNRPFESRAQAQEWCNAWNQQVQNEYNQTVAAYEQQLLQEQRPSLELIAFAPELKKMDEYTSDIFNELIEPYEIYDADGDVVGYNVDLQQAAAKASSLAKKFESNYETRKAKANVQTPAVDIKSSSSGQGSTLNTEPKTLGEAMQMIEMQKKKGNK